MADEIRPPARLFRGMADLIDRDHTSRTRYEAIARRPGSWRPMPPPRRW
jgi:hypothetical protein